MIPGGGNSPAARDDQCEPSRAGTCCWLCGYAVIDPPRIIGQRHAGRTRIAHRFCLRTLGELDLDLPPVV